MSIRQFYRNTIPMVQHFTYLADGREEKWITDIIQAQGNLQPYKEGLGVDASDPAFTEFINYWVAYIKQIPTFDYTEAPEGVVLSQADTYCYINGLWLPVEGIQDWTRAGRAVKHYKLFIKGSGTGLNIPTLIKDLVPQPITNIVQRFENEVNELRNNIPLL